MKFLSLFFIIIFYLQLLPLNAQISVRLSQSVTSDVSEFKTDNGTTVQDVDSSYNNSAKGNDFHIIFGNLIGVGYSKSE